MTAPVSRRVEPAGPTCHACPEPATSQWHREGTDEEAAAYHANVDAWRISEGLGPMPEDAAIKRVPVLVAVYGCDVHSDPSADATTPDP